MNNTSPFTCTPGVAGSAFIDMHYADEIINNFESEYSYKYLYKILGLRGSGKSVIYTKVLQHFFAKKDEWLVYTLSSAGDQIQTLISLLSKEPFIISDNITTTVSGDVKAEGNALAIKGAMQAGVTTTISKNNMYYSDEATLNEMIDKASQNYKILIGIDDIAKEGRMKEFLSIIGNMILDPRKRVYLVCTGLAKNIEDFAIEPHLSFFVRGDRIVTKPFNNRSVASMYQNLLGIDSSLANEMAEVVKGYAYGYQVLGEIYFNKNEDESFESLLFKLDIDLGNQYDLIWNTLAPEEKKLIKIIALNDLTSSTEIKRLMKNSNSYNVLRDRLIKKHVLTPVDMGHIRIDLPRIKEYIESLN